MQNGILLQTQKIGKEFNKVWVLEDINFNLERKEVHSIVGENGAGKSTFIKIISGIHSQSSGEIFIEGEKREYNSPKESEELGIYTLHQEINLIPFFTIYENIFLGNEIEKKGLLDKKTMINKAEELLEMIGVKENVKKPVHELETSMKRIVQLCKVLKHSPEILIFDEPTTSLGEEERNNLLQIIKNLKNKGNMGIIFVSHDLDEVMEISDRVTVLRDGHKIDTLLKEDTSTKEITRKMIGKKSFSSFYRSSSSADSDVDKDPILELNNVTTNKLQNINLQLKPGEIVGIAGVMGAGKTELARAIFGLDEIDEGGIYYKQKKFNPEPRKAIEQGMILIPEERREEGLILNMDVKKNISISYLDRLFSGLFISESKERDEANRMIEQLDIKTEGPDQLVKCLSGGNQQKVVLGRWLLEDFNLGIFDEVTKGIDVGAKKDIYEDLALLADEGKAILFMSSYLPELLNLCDRILVIRKGRIIDEFKDEEFDENKIANRMLGGVQ